MQISGSRPSQAFRILKEAYLSVFILFCKVGTGHWTNGANAKAYTGILGLSIIENFLILSIFFGLQIKLGYRIELQRWVVGAVLFFPIILNYYFLIYRESGIFFEKQFNSFGTAKKIALMAVAISVVLMCLVIMYAVGSSYRRFFS